MTPDAYKVMTMAVEAGVKLGIRRAFKDSDSPSPEKFVAAIEVAVMHEIEEWFRFNEEHKT
jgi:hypothetical protein